MLLGHINLTSVKLKLACEVVRMGIAGILSARAHQEMGSGTVTSRGDQLQPHAFQHQR